MTLCVERAAICVKEIFSNQLTQKRRALPLGCSGRSLRSSDATEARQSDRARTKTRARPPICGLRRPVGVPNSPVSWRRKTPDTTKSDSRPSEPARLASSWPTRKAPRASRGPAGHQRRGAHHSQSRDDDNRDIRETHLKCPFRAFNDAFAPGAPAGRCAPLRCLLAPPGCRVELGRRWAGLGWSNSTSIDRGRARRTGTR